MRFLMLDASVRAHSHLSSFLALGTSLLPLLGHAQPYPVDAMPLKDSIVLQERIDPAARPGLPSFITGDQITGRPDLETVIDGHAVLRKGDLVIKADRMEYNQATDLAKARGHVRINRAGCLDQCEHGPTVVVYPEAVWYGPVTAADVEEIVSAHLVAGRPVARLRLADGCINTGACAHKPRRPVPA